jgi:hypothetical protein
MTPAMIKTLRTFPTNNTVISRKLEDRKTKIVTIGNFKKLDGIVKPSVGAEWRRKAPVQESIATREVYSTVMSCSTLSKPGTFKVDKRSERVLSNSKLELRVF